MRRFPRIRCYISSLGKRRRTLCAVVAIVLVIASCLCLTACDNRNRKFDEIHVVTWSGNGKFVLGTFETKGILQYNTTRFEFNVPDIEKFVEEIEKDSRLVPEMSKMTNPNFYLREYVFFENGYYRLSLSPPILLQTERASFLRGGDLYRFPIDNEITVVEAAGDRLAGDLIRTDKSWEFYLDYYSRFSEESCLIDETNKTITIEATNADSSTFVRLKWNEDRSFSVDYDVQLDQSTV